MSRLSGWPLIVAAAALWGTTGTAQDLGPAEAGSATVGAMRMVIGGAALLLVAALRSEVPDRRLLRMPATLAAGAAMAAYQPLFFTGVARTGVAVGTAIAIGSAPVLAGGLSWLIGERPTSGWLRATGVAVAGVAVLVSATGADPSLDLVGGLACAGAGAAYAIYAVATRRIVRFHSPVAVAAAVFGLAGAALAPVVVVGDVGWAASGQGAAMALWLGLAATAAAYLLYTNGLRSVSAPTAATLSLVEPITAAILGVVVLAERPPGVAWIGALLVVAGLVAMVRGAAQPS